MQRILLPLLLPALALPVSVLQASHASASTGAAVTFGGDASGQIGNGAAGATSTPSPVLAGVSDVAGGREFSLALVQGTVYAWGGDTKGQLGNGTPLANAAGPVRVALPTDLPATAVATGHYHGLALMGDGTLRAWGWNNRGQLGPQGGTALKSAAPKVIALSGVVQQVAGGRAHSIALLTNGEVYAWGDNGSGQLGQGSADDVRHATPMRVPGLPPIAFVAGGRDSTFAIDVDGQLWAWGNNTYGQLGIGSMAAATSPVAVSGLTDVRHVESGADHTVASTWDGRVFTWGRNRYAQLGYSGSALRLRPTRVMALDAQISKVAVGRDHTIAMTAAGDTYTWGRNDGGQLGVSSTTTPSSSTALLIPSLNGTIDAGGGQVHSIVLDAT